MHFSEVQLRGLPAQLVIKKVLEEKGVDWHSCSEHFKYGLVIKRKLKNKTTFVRHLGKEVETMRTVFIAGGLNHLEALPPDVAAQALMLKRLNFWEDNSSKEAKKRERAEAELGAQESSVALLKTLLPKFVEIEDNRYRVPSPSIPPTLLNLSAKPGRGTGPAMKTPFDAHSGWFRVSCSSRFHYL